MGTSAGSRRSPGHVAAASVAVVAALASFTLGVVGASALDAPSSASDAEIERAEEALEAAGRARAVAAGHFANLDAELRELQSRIRGLSGGDREYAEQIRQHHDRARTATVDAYVWAGRDSDLDHLFNGTDVEERAVRRHFVVGRVDRATEAIDELAAARYGVDAELIELGELEADLVARHGVASTDMERAVAAEAAAKETVADARAKAARLEAVREERRQAELQEQRAAAAAPAATTTSSGGPTEEQWERLRQCESTGNYQVVSASGKYRGAYQFDIPTWQSMGGTGDPAAAPEWEQDARAKALYELRGWRPWPHCGKHLIP